MEWRLLTSSPTEISLRRRVAKWESSMFMRCLFAGWFSATAKFEFYLTFLLLQAGIYDLLNREF
jgi:hypothetical protein